MYEESTKYPIIRYPLKRGDILKLSNFKQEVDEVILKRGYHYFKDGHVLGKRLIREGCYEVLVIGHEDYTVNIQLDSNGTIISYRCNCPYRGGPICKHEVAAFYALAASFQPKESELVQLLKTLPVETLVHELAEVADHDVGVYQHLMSYQKESDLLAQFEVELEEVVAKHIHLGHTVTGKAIERLTDDLTNLMMHIQQTNPSHTMLLKCQMALLLREECDGMEDQIDDTDAVFTDFLGELHALLQSIMFQTLNDEQEASRVFSLLMTKLKASTEIDFELLDLMFEYGCQPMYLTTIVEYLAKMIDVVDEKIKPSLYKCWYKLLARYSEAESMKFLNQYQQMKGLQAFRLDQLLQQEAYKEALFLILELESLEEHQFDLSLKETRYFIYEKLGQVEEMKQLAYELFLGGQFKYYQILKDLYGDEFASLYKDLKQSLSAMSQQETLYLKMLECERDKDAILDHVKHKLQAIETYANILWDEYPVEVCELYERYIQQEIKQAMNRTAYRRICMILRRFRSYTTFDKYEAFIQELLQMFPRRRALREELHQLIQEVKREKTFVEVEQLSIEIA